MLLSKLNQHTKPYVRDVQTQKALNEAKRALISYAMNYPELRDSDHRGPGFLPCPDGNDNGEQESNCSENQETTLGRLPFKTLGLSDVRDSSGERLWYAVSQNFKFHQPVTHVLNSETPGTISVDNINDIVAVVIAAGEPVGVQTGRPSTDPQDYLEGANADGNVTFFTEIGSGDFNDRLVMITRQELMNSIEQRVMNEARRVLAQYYDRHGAYPWLAPFTDEPKGDPKAGGRWLWGTAGSGSNSTTLRDGTADFNQARVAPGDIVWNLTDGSWGTVLIVDTENRLIISPLAFGDRNEFRSGSPADEYYIEIRDFSGALSGIAGPGTLELTLQDSGKDFEKLGVVPGDVIDIINGETGPEPSGMVTFVRGNELEVSSLNGAGGFNEGDRYRIRSNTGVATLGSGAGNLEDEETNFITLGVKIGDTVRNLTDGSTGVVYSVDVTELTVSNEFSNNDRYLLSRFNAAPGTARGLLPIHEPGEALDTGFSVDWSITEANDNSIELNVVGVDPAYSSGLENAVQTSNSHSNTVSVDAEGASCVWVSMEIVDCMGSFIDEEFLSGTVESAAAGEITDNSRNFPSIGIKSGDKIEKVSSSEQGMVYQVSSDTVQYIGVSPGTMPEFAPGDNYRIHVSASISGQVAAVHPTSIELGEVYFDDSSASQAVYENTRIGDVIRDVEGGGLGQIIAKGIACDGDLIPILETCLGEQLYYFNYGQLQDGVGSIYYLENGDSFVVHQDYVHRREYAFNMKFGGRYMVSDMSGTRTRMVCHGHEPDCMTGPSEERMPGDGSTPLVAIQDFDIDGDPLGDAAVRVPAAGDPRSSIRVSDIAHQLAVSEDEFPVWFLKNRWHQYIYVAYSEGFGPGGIGNCTAGTDCLILNVYHPGNVGTPTVFDDRQAIVLSMGRQLDWQNRGEALLENYLENVNASDDPPEELIFEKNFIEPSFNDQVRVICPDPYYPNPNDLGGRICP